MFEGQKLRIHRNQIVKRKTLHNGRLGNAEEAETIRAEICRTKDERLVKTVTDASKYLNVIDLVKDQEEGWWSCDIPVVDWCGCSLPEAFS